MDIDENTGQGTPPAQPPNADIEQLLLLQFSRMGTTDHDELVNQLQRVLGNQLNYATARFFLDMNNWWVLFIPRRFCKISYEMQFMSRKRHFCPVAHRKLISFDFVRLCLVVFIFIAIW